MGSAPKLVSVIITAYNVERYISACIDSVMAQGNCVQEVIVVDDGSIDNTSVICNEYAQKYDIIKVIHQNNQGCSAARNAGLERARGDYIAFVDGDDYLKPDMYRILIQALENNHADIAICNFDNVSENGDFLGYIDAMRDECVSGREALRWVERPCFWAASVVWNRLYKREIFAGLSFPVGKIHEDEYVFHETFLRSKRIVSIKDSLYCYRLHKDSVMASSLAGKRVDGFDAIYNRYNCYNELGYTELYRGTIERAKGMMWIIYKGNTFSSAERERIKKMVKNYREMVHKAGRGAGLLNHIIALSPRMYYRVRGIIKGR